MLTNKNFDNQELSISLLSVRAGLSTISNILDEINEETQKVENVEKKLKNIEMQIVEIPNRIKSASQSLNDLQESNNALNSEIKSEQKKYIKERSFFYEITAYEGLAPTFYISLILSFILSIIMLSSKPPLEYLTFLIIPLLVFVISLIVGIIFTLIHKKSKLEDYKNSLERLKDRISSNTKGINFYKNCIEDYKNKLVSLPNEQKTTKEELLIITRKTSRTIAELKESAKTIANGLSVNYGHLITESDWENLDLIIYYFTTGRASNMKEALYQVDRQRQNDVLVKAIKSSTQAICSHIQMATTMLSTQLNNSFAMLQSSIKTFIENNTVQNKNLLTLVAGQIESNKITNALLEKQNRTSLQLYEDYKRIQYANGQWLYT